MSACNGVAVPDSDQAVSATLGSLDGERRYGLCAHLARGMEYCLSRTVLCVSIRRCSSHGSYNQCARQGTT